MSKILDILEIIAQKNEDKKREVKIEARVKLPGEYIE